MASAEPPAPKARLVSLRYKGTCEACGAALEARTKAWYDADRRRARCSVCGPVAAATRTPGRLNPPPSSSTRAPTATKRLERCEGEAKREGGGVHATRHMPGLCGSSRLQTFAFHREVAREFAGRGMQRRAGSVTLSKPRHKYDNVTTLS